MERGGDEADTCSLRGASGRGLINTRGLGVEPQTAVYSSPQYQVVVAPPQQEHGGGPPQVLDPSALLPHLRPAPGLLLCPESVLRIWGEGVGDNCCETTFIEGLGPEAQASAAAAASKEVLLLADGKFLDFSGDDTKISTLSYDIDDDDEFQELEVRSSLGLR